MGHSQASRFSILVCASFLAGLLTSYGVFGQPPALAAETPVLRTDGDSDSHEAGGALDTAALMEQVNPRDGYRLGVEYGTLGPRLVAAGVIDAAAFIALYERAGAPLSALQLRALESGSDEEVVITPENAYFLLNYFWAVGLANTNAILTEGAMVEQSGGSIDRFASTGGWSISTTPVTEIYSSLDLIELTAEQQARVEEVASAVYRPCCGNSTLFPDCNHGMATLGVLELMASEDASTDEMFRAAKYINAFWFPQQALESAIYLAAVQGIDFAEADARMVVGASFASGAGSASIHRELQVSGLLPRETAQGGNCAN
jgi:hypothetical protein